MHPASYLGNRHRHVFCHSCPRAGSCPSHRSGVLMLVMGADMPEPVHSWCSLTVPTAPPGSHCRGPCGKVNTVAWRRSVIFCTSMLMHTRARTHACTHPHYIVTLDKLPMETQRHRVVDCRHICARICWILYSRQRRVSGRLWVRRHMAETPGQDGGIGRHTAPPRTTKRRATTNLKTKNNQK